MADQKRSTFASSSTNGQTVEKQRNPGQDDKTQQTERDTGDDQALQSPTHMDVDQADRSQTVQSQEESPCVPRTQIVTGTTMNTVGNKGPVQIGASNVNTVIKNPVYKNCNVQHHHHHHHHHHPASFNPDNYSNYLRMVEQAASSLEPGPSFPGQPSCPVPQSPVGNPLQDHTSRDEDPINRDTAGQSQTDMRTVHPAHHNTSRDNTSNHVPCHCQDCLLYHHNDHIPLDEQHHRKNRDSKPRHQRLSHPPIPQLSSPRQTGNEESTKGREKVKNGERRANPASDTHTANRNQPTQENAVQRSSLSLQPSDVTPTVTRVEQGERKQAKASNTADTQRKGNIKSRGVPRPDETSPVFCEGIPDSVCIIDSKGQSLEPGDAVWFERDGDRKWGIYVGHQQVVWPDWSRGRLVRKEELKLAQPFGKLRVVRKGDVRPFPRGEVIRRAESRVGTDFTEGHWSNGWDFPVWAMTGLRWDQAWDRGFILYED